MVSAWCETNHLVLGQLATEEKSNEIKAIPQLLKLLNVRDAVVTIDAMGCQKAIAQEIIWQSRSTAAHVNNPGFFRQRKPADHRQGLTKMRRIPAHTLRRFGLVNIFPMRFWIRHGSLGS